MKNLDITKAENGYVFTVCAPDKEGDYVEKVYIYTTVEEVMEKVKEVLA